jgi:hypothetical protein
MDLRALIDLCILGIIVQQLIFAYTYSTPERLREKLIIVRKVPYTLDIVGADLKMYM